MWSHTPSHTPPGCRRDIQRLKGAGCFRSNILILVWCIKLEMETPCREEAENTSPEIWQLAWFHTKSFDGRVKRNKWIQNWMYCHVLSIHDTSEFQAKSGSSRHFARSLQHFWTASGPIVPIHYKWSAFANKTKQNVWGCREKPTVLGTVQ